MRSLSLATHPQASAADGPPKVLLRGERAARGSFRLRLPLDRPPPFGLEIALTLAVLFGAAGYGSIRGGQFQDFVARHGSVGDVAARALGFGVDMVTVSGAAHMSEARLLTIAGVTATDSLPFFDVAAAKARLEADPLVKQASVRKLYPDQLVIDIVERTPYALWQKDGQVKAIGADGGAIDDVSDGRYAGLPFVVGEGANLRAREFTALLDAMEELRTRVEAGILIDQRRWNLRLKSGLDIKLPEDDPQAAIATLVKLEREQRILDKDVLALDFRAPDRVFVRLTRESAEAWAEAHAPKKKDAQP
ncbi:cell division protein FtsQ [Roseiarcus fermentans]|uniref:Cell division protein FtsQ n=1 Tax=Roseiarcus fermentans TaxID=1473586 RepID=A0A366FW03_9HYPH|nr:FtsQ-type POTRA domain-containing protein [Roseiarcus fermentans]RBP18210.1 cell division protein FtsQ [Roseiarcus fermentans]